MLALAFRSLIGDPVKGFRLTGPVGFAAMPRVVCEEQSVARFHRNQRLTRIIDLAMDDPMAFERLERIGHPAPRGIIIVGFVLGERPVAMTLRHDGKRDRICIDRVGGDPAVAAEFRVCPHRRV